MITSNLKKILFGFIYNPSGNGGANNFNLPTTSPNLVNTDGVTLSRANYAANYHMYDLINTLSFAGNDSTSNTVYMTVGTGTTEPTEDDYNLETPNEDITISTATQGVKSDYSGKVYTFTLYNSTSDDITITEIGLIGILTKWNTGHDHIMFDRTVLDTPITIPAGESKPITYEIGF